MKAVTDFHSHVLPGIDDGSQSVEESIAMLRMEAEQGILHVIATPHFYPKYDSPRRFLERRENARMRLLEAMEAQNGLPKISVGAEVYFFHGISDSEELSGLTIADSRYVLLEMPQSPWTPRMYKEIEDIRDKQGLIPIIAHVDRYIRPFKTYDIPERLQDLPVLVQANASFFLHRSTAGMALRMLKKDQIHLLGSDCHNLKDRAPNLSSAVERISRRLGDDVLMRIQDYEQEVMGLM